MGGGLHQIQLSQDQETLPFVPNIAFVGGYLEDKFPASSLREVLGAMLVGGVVTIVQPQY